MLEKWAVEVSQKVWELLKDKVQILDVYPAPSGAYVLTREPQVLEEKLIELGFVPTYSMWVRSFVRNGLAVFVCDEYGNVVE